jgi:hypothetical protein
MGNPPVRDDRQECKSRAGKPARQLVATVGGRGPTCADPDESRSGDVAFKEEPGKLGIRTVAKATVANISGETATPGGAWVTGQAHNASMQMAEWGLSGRFLLLDHDAKFTRESDAVFAAGAPR